MPRQLSSGRWQGCPQRRLHCVSLTMGNRALSTAITANHVCAPSCGSLREGKASSAAFAAVSVMLPHPQCSQHPAHTSKYVGAYDGLELSLGSYKFLATVDDCKNTKFPRTFAFIFMTDVSYNGTRRGPVRLLCEQLKVLLDFLPTEGGQKSQRSPLASSPVLRCSTCTMQRAHWPNYR